MQFCSSEELSLWFTCSSASHRKGLALLCQIVDPAYFQLIPSTCPTRPQSQRAGPTLSFGAFFHGTYILTGSAETMRVEPTWPVSAKVSSPSKSALLSSVVQGSVLSASVRLHSLDLLLLCSGDVAACCSEVTRVRRRPVRKAPVNSICNDSATFFFWPSLGSVPTAATVGEVQLNAV